MLVNCDCDLIDQKINISSRLIKDKNMGICSPEIDIFPFIILCTVEDNKFTVV